MSVHALINHLLTQQLPVSQAVPRVNVVPGIAHPQQPMMLDENNQPVPATLPVRYGNVTMQTSLPRPQLSSFDLKMQRFNNLSPAQRAQQLGLNDWQSRWEEPGPQPPHTYPKVGNKVYLDGTTPFTPLLDKIKGLF